MLLPATVYTNTYTCTDKDRQRQKNTGKANTALRECEAVAIQFHLLKVKGSLL